MRQAEILGLCWHDIDWENGCIYIRNQLQQRQVRGDFSYYLAPPKEGKERRVILADSTMQVLREQKSLQEHMRKIAEPVWDNPWNLVFTNDFGKPPSRRTVYKHLNGCCVPAARVIGHSIRSGILSQRFAWKMAMISKLFKQNLGHYAASFTLKTYAHVSDRMQQNSAARMEKRIQSLSQTDQTDDKD